MNKIIFTLVFLLSAFTIKAQDEHIHKIEKETIDIVDEKQSNDEISFAVVEHVPVYSSCNEKLSNLELKKCMNIKISNLISKHFNVNLAKTLNLPDGVVKIYSMFKINKDGNVVDITTKAPHPDLEKEAIRVLNLIPKFKKPGIQKGNPVTVPYILPIVFKIDNSKPLTKKERRKLRKKQR
jgi:hypothetical protein